MGWLLGMYEEWTIFTGCIYVFHQLAAAVRPGFTGKGNSLLNKVVKNLHLAECGKTLCDPKAATPEATVQAAPS